MELYNEDNDYFKIKKKSKTPLIIGGCIALLVVMTIIIVYLIIYLKSTVMRIKVDGVNKTRDIESILDIEQNEFGTELYIPIRKIAKYLNYEDYSGDYKNKSEDANKCYVKNEYETAMFTLDSATLLKVRENNEYDYITLDEKVFQKDGELYTTIDGIKNAFNVEFIYNAEKRTVDIYTMEYLVTTYATRLNYTDKEYTTDFNDQKAIFEGMLVVQTEDKMYGVVDVSTGKFVLENKYDSIKYVPSTTDFIVGSNGKYGIVQKDALVKVKTAYDEIKMMDNKNKLFLVKQEKLYGVLDSSGNTVIEPDYEQVGISNVSTFSENGIENQYVLLDQLIPLKKNSLWGFYNISGKQITEFKYTGVGCTTSKLVNTYPVLTVPSYNIIIVEKDKLFNLMGIDGSEKIQSFVLDSVYMKTNAATSENTYFMTYNGNTDNIEERLQALGE